MHAWGSVLKGLSLSFHKIVEIKYTEFLIQVMAAKRVPKSFAVEHFSTAVTLVLSIQFQLIFWKLRKRHDVFKSKFCWDYIIRNFSALDHGIAKLANTFLSLKYEIWLHLALENSFYKLSENYEKIYIGSMEFKLWKLKESPNYWLSILLWYRQIDKYFYLLNMKFYHTS